ncbi:MAG: hypothetical protein IJE90_01185 [Clostridia bacterium]|nr:hypothetical protein [Clostridia bacterium]
MKKMLALLLALMMLAAAFAGCGDSGAQNDNKQNEENKDNASQNGNGDSQGDQSGDGTTAEEKAPLEGNGIFKKYISTSATTLYGVSSSDPVVSTVTSPCSTYLFRAIIDDTGDTYHYEPMLASELPIQMDTEGKVWQIKIRQGYRWENGDEMNADTVLFSYQTAIDPLLMNISAANIYNNTYVQVEMFAEYAQQNMLGIMVDWSEVGLKKIDEYTVEVHTVKPTTQEGLTKFMTTAMIHKPTWDKAISPDGSSTLYGTSMEYWMSSGEYILTEWIVDSQFTYKKNQDYVKADMIWFAGMEIRVVPDANTALELFLNGELHTAAITYAQWEDYEDDPRVYEYWNDSTMFLWVNTGNPKHNNMLGNYNFRKALFYGMDRNEFASTLGGYPCTRLFRRSVVGDSNTGTSILDLPCDWQVDPYTAFQPALASEYVDKAFEETGNVNVEFEIYYKEDGTHTRAATEIMQRQLTKNLEGVNIKLRAVPQAQAYSLRRWNPNDPDSFDFNIGSLLPGNEPLDTLKFYGSNYQPLRFYWNDESLLAEHDRLYQEAIIFNDEGKEAEMVANCLESERILVMEAMQQIPIYEIPTKQLYAENIELPGNGYVINYGFGDRYAKFID